MIGYPIKINLRVVPKLVAYKTIPQKVSNCCMVLPVSFPLAIQDMPYVVLYTGLEFTG